MPKKAKKFANIAKEKVANQGAKRLIIDGLHYTADLLDYEPYKNVYPYPAPSTTIQFHTEGIGDLMIVRLFGRALQRYYNKYGDPELGKVVISGGALNSALDAEEGDTNLLWWWNFGDKDDEPNQFFDYYLEECSVEPDAVLCLSKKCVREADQLGFETLYLPLGVCGFEPLGFERSGLGYAGSKYHKTHTKEDAVLSPFLNADEFEWVSHFKYPEQLNQWYNTKLITFGLHLEGQRQWGMVNNRVFETLASGTPFILEKHPDVSDILGFEYPYQTSSKKETRKLVREIQNNPGKAIAEFTEYAESVRKNHSYNKRVKKLIEFLK